LEKSGGGGGGWGRQERRGRIKKKREADEEETEANGRDEEKVDDMTKKIEDNQRKEIERGSTGQMGKKERVTNGKRKSLKSEKTPTK
jgi:hypothetical protein